MQIESQPSVPQPFAQEKISQFCTLNADTPLSLNENIEKRIFQTYSYDLNRQIIATFKGDWQVGDPSCANRERAPSLEECINTFSTVLNGCDTDSIEQKYGGSKIVDCIDWTITVDSPSSPIPNPPRCKHL